MSITMALVSFGTRKGWASQHQSPSRKTLCGSRVFTFWQAAVLPTPMAPPIRYRVLSMVSPPFSLSYHTGAGVERGWRDFVSLDFGDPIDYNGTQSALWGKNGGIWKMGVSPAPI